MDTSSGIMHHVTKLKPSENGFLRFTVHQWPPKSPDLNWKEHLWDVVGWEIHHLCSANKSAATAWSYHVNMDQNLWETVSSTLLNLWHKELRWFWWQKGVQPSISKVYLMKWVENVFLYIHYLYLHTVDKSYRSFFQQPQLFPFYETPQQIIALHMLIWHSFYFEAKLPVHLSLWPPSGRSSEIMWGSMFCLRHFGKRQACSLIWA